MSAAGADRLTETARIEAALKAVPWPKFVTGHEWKLDYDWTGEWAIWVWIVVTDYKDVERNRAAWAELRSAIREALPANGVDLWPYIRVRAENEHPTRRRKRG